MELLNLEPQVRESATNFFEIIKEAVENGETASIDSISIYKKQTYCLKEKNKQVKEYEDLEDAIIYALTVLKNKKPNIFIRIYEFITGIIYSVTDSYSLVSMDDLIQYVAFRKNQRQLMERLYG